MKQTLSIIFLFLVLHTFGITVSGKIVDANNQPIPFVNILIKGTTTGTTGDLYGSYSINLSPGKYELVFRLLGYELREEKINVLNNDQILNVKLLQENFLLNETSVNANQNNIEFATNKVLAISELYSDIAYYRYFSSFMPNDRQPKLLIALLNYSYKSTSYSSFINGLNELFKYDDKVKFSTNKALLNHKYTFSGKYQYVGHTGAGKTASRYALKDRRGKTLIKDTILSGQYSICIKKIGDSIYFQCPGLYNEKEISSASIASINAFINAYYTPYYIETPVKMLDDLPNKIIAKIGNKNERVASLIMFDKQITNFYPYNYDTLLFQNRFKACLIFADTAAILSDTANMDSFYDLLGYFQNVIHDNHIKIFTNIGVHGKAFVAYNIPYKNLPIKIFIKNLSAYIEDAVDSTYKNLIGSKIISVNDTDIATYIKNKSIYISYTNQLSKENKLEESLFQTEHIKKNYKLKLQKKDGSLETVVLKSENNYYQNKDDKDWMYYTDLSKTKLYIDLNSNFFSSKKALKEIEKNKKIERIIFDVLLYPNLDALDLIAHFTDKPLLSPTFISNFTSNPFGSIVHKKTEDHWTQKALKPTINIPCVFLVRGTYSWGETFLDIIKANKIGKLVGEETGGTNGDVIYNNLPIYGYMYTSIKTINNSDHLPANESSIKPDILFEKNEKNYLNYRNELIKYASTIPTN